MVFDKILKLALPGTVIPKPQARGEFKVKGIGRRRGEEALIYYIPNHKKPSMPYQKGITRSEFETAYRQLLHNGTLTKAWFNNVLSACASEGSCNFTTLGGLFKLIGEAEYDRPGIYRRTDN